MKHRRPPSASLGLVQTLGIRSYVIQLCSLSWPPNIGEYVLNQGQGPKNKLTLAETGTIHALRDGRLVAA